MMPSITQLDDLSIDIPQAFIFAANLIIACGLPDSDVEELASAIETYEEGDTTAKDKLIAQVNKLRG